MDKKRTGSHAEFLRSPEYSRALDGVCIEYYGVPEETRQAMDAIGAMATQERHKNETFEESLKIETGLYELYDPEFSNAFTREVRGLCLPFQPEYCEAEPPKGTVGPIYTNQLLIGADSEVSAAENQSALDSPINLFQKGLDIIEDRKHQEKSKQQKLVSPGNVSTLALFVHRRLPQQNEKPLLHGLDFDEDEQLEALFDRWMADLEQVTEGQNWNRIEIGSVVKFLPLASELGKEERLSHMITEQLLLNIHNVDQATKDEVMAAVARAPESVRLPRAFGLAFELLEARETVFDTSGRAVDTVKALRHVPPEDIGGHVYHNVLNKLEAYEEVFDVKDVQRLVHALKRIDDYRGHDEITQRRLFEQVRETIRAVAADPSRADVKLIESLATTATQMRGSE
jgi:hypothetical protein